MDKWERLKEQMRHYVEFSKQDYDNAEPRSDKKDRYLQHYIAYQNVLDNMDDLEKKFGKDDFNQRFLKFLSKGISAKEWETTLQRTIKKYPDEANFWEGYTTALIQVKVYYEKLMKGEK